MPRATNNKISGKVLTEQTISTSINGPAITTSVDINPSAFENSFIIKNLIERHITHDGANTSKKPSSEVICIDNQKACKHLVEILPSKKTLIDWNSALMCYLVSGGPCPPLGSVLTKQKSISMPATLPIHLLLEETFNRPKTPCFVEPVSGYFRAVLRRSVCIPNGHGAIPGSAFLSSNAEWLNSTGLMSGDITGTKEWSLVEAELMLRFGFDAKINKMTVTHSIRDVVRLAYGFAAGLKSRTFSRCEPERIQETKSIQDSDSSDDSVTKENSEETIEIPAHQERLNILHPSEISIRPPSYLPLKIPFDASAINPSSADPNMMYKQSSRVIGLVSSDEQSSSNIHSANSVKYDYSIGILATPGVESMIVSLACPIIDVVPYQMDVSLFTAEQLYGVLRNRHFSTMVVDDLGFELLVKAHILWTSKYTTNTWPIQSLITTSVFETHSGFSDLEEAEIQALLREVNVVDIDDVIVKEFSVSLSRLLRYRTNLSYSITELSNRNSPFEVQIHPRVIGRSYDHQTCKPFEPVWSNTVLSSVAGLLSFKKTLDWSLQKTDVTMITRIELPSGESFENEIHREASAAYHIALATIAVGGKVAFITLARLLHKCNAVQEAVKKLKPTIVIGSISTWSTFTKRLANEAGIDGAVAKTWRGKVVEKRSKIYENHSKIEYQSEMKENKHFVKDMVIRKCIDSIAFRRGRHLLGTNIRIAIICEPLNGNDVMHQKTLDSLCMLLSSSRDLRIVQAFAVSGLGGRPFAFVSNSVVNTGADPKYQNPIHSGDPLYNERCSTERVGRLNSVMIPPELTDRLVSSYVSVPCYVNPALNFMMSGVEETYYPLTAPHVDENCTPAVVSKTIACRLSRAIRLSAPSDVIANLEQSTRTFITGTFAQIQDGLLCGALFTRVCVDGKSRQKFRNNSISNFLETHAFHVLAVNEIKRLTFQDRIAQSDPFKYSVHTHGLPSKCLSSIIVDLEIELNPLCPVLGSSETDQCAKSVLKDYLPTAATELKCQITSGVLKNFALIWSQGVFPRGHYSNDKTKPSPTYLAPSARESIEGCLSRFGSNISIEQCVAIPRGLSSEEK